MVNVSTRAPRYRILATKRGDIPRDVTDYVLAVTTSKDLNSFVGKFSLTLRNRIEVANPQAKDNKLRDIKNIEEFFRPMTFIQIFARTKTPDEVPVMRGFVDSVGNSESVGEASGNDRSIVNGSDMGKIFIKQRLFFRPELSALMNVSIQKESILEGAAENAVAIRVGDFISAQYSISLFNRAFTPNQFIHEMLNIFVQPYIEKVLKNYNVPRLGEHLSGSFIIDTGVQVVPLKLFLANLTTHQGSILNVLNYAKNAPWCEMFLQEGEDRTLFVFRATPWRAPDGQGSEKEIPLMTRRREISLNEKIFPGEGSHSIDINQEVRVTRAGREVNKFQLNKKFNNKHFRESESQLREETKIELRDVISREIFRDDSDVFTYFSVSPNQLLNWKIATLNNLYQDQTATSNPFLLRAHTDFYGFRPMEFKSTFSPFLLDAKNQDQVTKGPDGKSTGPEQQLKVGEPLLRTYLRQFNTALVDAFRYNVDYEKGSIRIMGDPTIRIGQYITMEVRNAREATFYVEGVSHSFTAFDRFITTLRLSRGTAAINNGNSIVDQFLNPLEAKAVAQDKKRLYNPPDEKVVNSGADNSLDLNKQFSSGQK